MEVQNVNTMGIRRASLAASGQELPPDEKTAPKSNLKKYLIYGGIGLAVLAVGFIVIRKLRK